MKLKFTLLILLAIIIVPLGISTGPVRIPLGEMFTDKYEMIIQSVRIPRTLAAFFSGVALSLSGLILQTVFSNPLAGPFVLGIASGSLTGAIFLIFFNFTPGFWNLTLSSFAGSMSMTVLIIMIASIISNRQIILLIGIMSGYFLAALVNILVVFAPASEVKDYHIWTLGSFARFIPDFLFPFCLTVAALLAVSFLMIKPLNSFLVGHDYARTIGIAVRRNRIVLLIIASLLTAIVTAFAGPISFVGLASPHIARIIFRVSDHKFLIPASCLIGAVLLTLCDVVARILIPPNDIPIGLITSIIGAPIIIYLLWKTGKR